MAFSGRLVGDCASHVCAFYSEKRDLIELLVPYFVAGIANGDSCMWIVSGVLAVNEAVQSIERASRKAGIRAGEGQMEVLSFDNWYLHGGVFHADQVMNRWRERISFALAGKRRRLRVAGDTSWVDPADWNRFLQYENEVNHALADGPITAVCTYPIGRTPRGRIGEALASHQIGVIKRQGEWQVVWTTGGRDICAGRG